MAYSTIVICSIVTLYKVGKDYKYIIQFLSKEFKIKVPNLLYLGYLIAIKMGKMILGLK